MSNELTETQKADLRGELINLKAKQHSALNANEKLSAEEQNRLDELQEHSDNGEFLTEQQVDAKNAEDAALTAEETARKEREAADEKAQAEAKERAEAQEKEVAKAQAEAAEKERAEAEDAKQADEPTQND